MTRTEAIKETEELLSKYYDGREDEVRDPTQLRVLTSFLQVQAYQLGSEINKLYVALGVIIAKYNTYFCEIRRQLEEEIDITHIPEKKVENMCLQKSEELQKLYEEKIKIKYQIKGLENEQKYLGYLVASLKHLIQKVDNEWKMAQEV